MSTIQDTIDRNIHEEHEVKQYFFSHSDGKSVISEFDSAVADSKTLPTPLHLVLDALQEFNTPKFDSVSKIDQAIQLGVNAYQANNAGDLPHPSIIAGALYAGLQVATNKQLPDSVVATIAKFDTFTNEHYEQAAIVPAMTVITIASFIANALPIIAYLPNPTGSVRVPIVSARMVTDSDFGAMRQGEYIDGINAALPYAEGRLHFAMDKDTDTTYKLTAHILYKDYAEKTTDTASPLLAFLSGNVSIRVNGVEVAHTRGNPELSQLKGVISAVAKKGVTLGGKLYKVVSSSIDIDNSTLQVEFNQALPDGARVEAYLIADFDAKDSNKNFKMTPVGASFAAENDSIQTAPIVNRITVNVNANNQFANELGLGLAGAAMSAIQGKVTLEQTARLLREGKERAIYNGRVMTFDCSLGVAGNLTNMTNTYGDLVGRITLLLDLAKLKVKQATGITTGFDLYVGDKAAVLFSQMSAEKFTRSGAYAGYGEIACIGILADGTRVYHTPTDQGVLNEGGRTAEVMIVGRSGDPVRNPFVGTVAMPPTIIEAKPDHREIQIGFHAQVAAELNPLSRYADQIAVVQMINLPGLA